MCGCTITYSPSRQVNLRKAKLTASAWNGRRRFSVISFRYLSPPIRTKVITIIISFYVLMMMTESFGEPIRCKEISDRIALRHHISIIECPKKTYNHKYGDYLSRQRKNSWKENLKAELDELVMRDDVRSIDDLTEKLKEKGYGVNLSYLQMQGRTLDMGEYRGFKLSISFDTLTKYVIQI